MGIEIERKFLVNKERWKSVSKPPGQHYKQGYILLEPDKTIRIRLAEMHGFITIKGRTIGASRPEYEYEIPVNDARDLLDNFCIGTLTKTRYKIKYKNKLWEIDEFSGNNDGLFIAEIELKSESELFDIPEWVEREVTGDAKYYNANLIMNPYQN
ncbi:MAG TPA: CYTH domain-containing protein [Hanamia sp.]